jgi:bifunctional non-homologous end joining protein LigD
MLFTPLKPMLLSNHKVTPFSLTDPNLLYEPKYDGWRLLLHKEGSKIEIYTRHGNVVTNRFPEFIEAAAGIESHSVILDCEGVCFNHEPLRPDFGMFEARAKLTNPIKIRAAMIHSPATLIPFDVIMIDGHSLCTEKLVQRKKNLSEIITNGPAMMLPTYFIGDGQGLFDWTVANHWEGIVAKHISSRYRINRRPDRLAESWVKRKHIETTEAYILGYQENPFALLIGLQGESSPLPIPVAIVEFGFSNEEKIAFRRIAKQLHTVMRKNMQMIEPLLKCNVEYLERTNNGALRICTFRGFVK